MPSSIVVIGKLNEYLTYYNLINQEIIKGNIIVSAAILHDTKVSTIDGIPIFSSPNYVSNSQFDYIIALNNNIPVTQKLLEETGINAKILPVRIFEVAYFDFAQYVTLLKNTPSIIARHCWGGLLFHRLGLEFNSPFVNLFLSEKDFIKLAANFKFYMQQELIYFKNGYDPNQKKEYPIAHLHDIIIHFNHYDSFESAKTTWNNRKARLNWDNLLFETTAESENMALAFDALPLKHKLCFSNCAINSPNVIDFSAFANYTSNATLGMIVNSTATEQIPYFNLLNLLTNFDFSSRLLAQSTMAQSQLMYIKLFEKYKKSALYQLELRRAKKYDTEVKWELKDINLAYKCVEQFEIQHPRIVAKTSKIERLKTLFSENKLPNRFALKGLNDAYNIMSLMLLHRLENDIYFDDISLIAFNIDEIIARQRSYNSSTGKLNWIIEELPSNFIDTISIPYKYSVYCICGFPRLIIQSYKKSDKIALSVFDGNFIPLCEGIDYFINPNKTSRCIPVIPPSAYEILNHSIKLSKEVDNKFVRIDWYDNGHEPIFEEFNFFSDLTYSNFISISEELSSCFNKALLSEDCIDYSSKGYLVDSNKLYNNMSIPPYKYSAVYFELLRNANNGNASAMSQLSEYFAELANAETTETVKKLFQHLAIAWNEVCVEFDQLNLEKLLRRIKARWGFVKSKTHLFNERITIALKALSQRAKNSDWHKIRLAQFQLEFIKDPKVCESAKNLIIQYADNGLTYAITVRDKYLKNLK